MKEETTKVKNEQPKKPYVKPEVAKHTAASVVVGSCNSYASSTTSSGDYWY